MAKKQSTKPPVATSGPPSSAELMALLGAAYPAFEALVREASGRTAEWRKYSSKSPWVLRVSQGKRPLLYLRPEAGVVNATVLLGPRAVEAALAGRVSKALHASIRAAKVYPEGRPVQVPVKRQADVGVHLHAAKGRGVDRLG